MCLQISVSCLFVETSPTETAIHSHITQANIGQAPYRKAPPKDCVDKIAYRYTGKLVYVWKGDKKGRVGRVFSIGGTHAQVAFSGMTGGTGVQTIKREYLMR